MVDIEAFLREQAITSQQVHFIYDLAARQVVFVNAAYEWVLHGQRGRVNEELPALLQRLHPDDHAYLAECWVRWVQGQLHHDLEVRLSIPGRPDQWLALSPSYMPDSAGPGWIGGLLRDITVEKHYKAHVDQFNARKNALLEVLSLDLSDMLVLSQSLRWEVQEEVKEFIWTRLLDGLQRIEARGQEGAKLIQEFVNEEIQTSVTVDLNLERVELGEKLHSALQDYPRAATLASHTLEILLPAEPVYVALDVNKFLQIITNLLGNALKFTPDGGHLQVQALALGDEQVLISFSDNGIGIPAEQLPVVFERFTPARQPGLRGEKSVGVGLSICKTLVELHQGTLSVHSRPGQGTTFSIRLPRLPS